MALSQSEIQILLKAQDQASGAIGKVRGELGQLGGAGSLATTQLSGLGTTLLGVAASAAAFVGISSSISSVISAAAGFEEQMSAVASVAGGTAKELEELSDLALQLGEDTSFSALEAGKGLEALTKAGVSIGDIMTGAGKAALDLAAAGGIKVADAAEIAANAMNVFSLKGADMAHVADVIAGAANASAIDVNDFKFSLAAAGSVAATVGVSFEDLSVAIAAMGNAGIKGSDAGTSLKTFLLNLSPTTDKAKTAMKELGIITADGANQFFNAQGAVRPMAEIFGVLQNAVKNLTKEEQIKNLQVMFGTDAIRAAAIAAALGAGQFEELAGKINVSGQAAATAETRLDNYAGAVEKLSGSWSTFQIQLGRLALPAMRKVVEAADQMVKKMVVIIKMIPDAWRTALQAFNGEWEDSDTLPDFIRMVGNASIVARQFFDLFRGTISFESLETLRATLIRAVGPGATEAILSFVRAIGGAWNSISSFTTGVLLPALESIRGAVGRVIAWVRDLPAPFWTAIAAFGAVVTAAGPLRLAIAAVVAILGLLVAPLTALLSPLGLVALAVAALAAAWQANLGGIQDKAKLLYDAVAPIFDSLAVLIDLTLNGRAGLAFEIFLRMLGEAAGKIGTILSLWAAEFAKWAPGAIASLISGGAELVGKLVTWLREQVAAIRWADIWTAAVNVVAGMAQWFADLAFVLGGWIRIQVAFLDWTKIWAAAAGVIEGMAQWFVKLGDSFTDWFASGAAAVEWGKVWGAATDITKALNEMLTKAFEAIDWVKVVGSVADAAEKFKEWMVKMVGAVRWEEVGRAISGFFIDIFVSEMAVVFGDYRMSDAMMKGLLRLVRALVWVDFILALMRLINGAVLEAWDRAVSGLVLSLDRVRLTWNVSFIANFMLDVVQRGWASAISRAVFSLAGARVTGTPTVSSGGGRGVNPYAMIFGQEWVNRNSQQPSPRAVGGTMEPGRTHLVGEQGAELVRVGQVSRIESAETTRGLLTGGGGGGVNVSVVVAAGAVQVSSDTDSGLGSRIGQTISVALKALMEAEENATPGTTADLAGAF